MGRRLSEPVQKWEGLVVTVVLIVGFALGFRVIEDERDARHADVCALAAAFLAEQRIAQQPSPVPAGATETEREIVVHRNRIRAKALAAVEAEYRGICP